MQSPGDEHSVLSHQGNYIGHGAQAHHVGIAVQHGLGVSGKSAGQLKGHGNTGEILVGIAVVRAVGVHYGNGQGQGFLALMVICNDQIHAKLPAERRLFHGGDAAVYGDDKLHLVRCQLPQGDGV